MAVIPYLPIYKAEICPLQDDPDLAQLVQQRMAAAVALENDSEDDDEEDDYDGGTSEDADEQREGNEELEEVASSMSADEDEEMTALEENGDLGRHHHHKKHHHHHHHHKKKKHHKKHRRDEHACEAFLGLSRSEVRFGTVSGEYLHAAGGNNTCYQAVSKLWQGITPGSPPSIAAGHLVDAHSDIGY